MSNENSVNYILKNRPLESNFINFLDLKKPRKKEKISYFSENTRYDNRDLENHEISRVPCTRTRRDPSLVHKASCYVNSILNVPIYF